MLEDDDPWDITKNFGETWVVYRNDGFKGTNRPEAQNPAGEMLMRAISDDYLDRADWGEISEWREQYTTGSLLFASRVKKNLVVRKVKAVCELVQEEVIPLLADKEVDRAVARRAGCSIGLNYNVINRQTVETILEA
jgi:hypothetical protein